LKTDRDITSLVLLEWLGDYPWLLILDGLDEVPASSNRDDVLNAIDEFWIDANGVNADILVVATTRPQGYNKDFAPELYQHKYLTPLSKARAKHYAQRLLNIRYKQEEDRREIVYERLQRALDEETTARLMQSPLQITIMTALLGRIGTPPQERWSLFSQYYEVIYQRETERNIPASVILRDYQPDINAIHYQVGLLLQIESEYPERTGAKLSLERFSKLVELRLREEGHEGQDMFKLRDQIIEAAANRLVFLVGVEADEIGFEIRSLQEFMAAEAIMEGKDNEVRERLQRIAPISHWRNVFLFAAGKCFTRRQHLRDTIHFICADLNEAAESESKIVAFTKAGSQMAIDLLADGTARRQPKYARLLARLALCLLEQLPNQYQLRLSEVYEPKLEGIYQEELIARLQTPSPSQFGSWALLSLLVEGGISWAKTIDEKYWPDTPRERTDLINSIIDSTNYLWFLQKLNYDLLILSASDLSKYIQFYPRRYQPREDDFKILELLGSLTLRAKNFFECEVKFPKMNGIGFSFMLGKIEDKGSSLLLESTDFHPEWLPYRAAAIFTSDPSKNKLAEALRYLDKYSIPDDSLPYEHSIPWPLAAFLDPAFNLQDRLQIAEEIEKGNYGDIEQWKLAEHRWQENGITFQDLEYLVSLHQPFDQNVDKIGFPIPSGESFWLKDPDPVSLLQAFHAFLGLKEKTTFPHLITRIEKFMAFTLSVLSRSSDIFELISVEEFSDMLSKSAQLIWIYSTLIKSAYENASTDVFLKLINNLGYKTRLNPFESIDSKPIVQTLVTAFIEDPSRLNIFNILSQLIILGSIKPLLPHQLISLDRYKDSHLRQAAIILQLAQQDWEDFPADQLALNISEVSKEEDRIIDDVLHTIDRHNMVGQDVESLLIKLYHHLLENDNWIQAGQVWEAMDNLAQKRHSDLLSVWSNLGLPKGLDKLVQS
jgi:hypothetical protein